MAAEIDNDTAARKVVTSVLDAIEQQALQEATPMDVAHALTFIICLYKFKFGWTTEQVLSLYEKYVLKMEEALADPEPFAEG
tara:strand:- start:1352 stop:1597 length:246 start_codon:yes stop_codon:yes gene_type:complete